MGHLSLLFNRMLSSAWARKPCLNGIGGRGGGRGWKKKRKRVRGKMTRHFFSPGLKTSEKRTHQSIPFLPSMMLRCAPPTALTRQVARPASTRIAAAAGRVAGAPCVSAKHGIVVVVAPRSRLHRLHRLRCTPRGGAVRARAAVDLQSSTPPLSLLAGVTRHCLEVDYGGRKVSRRTAKEETEGGH